LVDEAGSRVRLRHAQVMKRDLSLCLDKAIHTLPLLISVLYIFCLKLPEEARELDKELRQITKEKNEAVRGQDFEKVFSFFSLVGNYFFLKSLVQQY
jgi:hypothetical protein